MCFQGTWESSFVDFKMIILKSDACVHRIHVHALELILTFVYSTVDVWHSCVHPGCVGKCTCPF